MVRSASPTAPDVLLVAVGPPGSTMDLTHRWPSTRPAGSPGPRVDLPTDDGVAVYTLQGSWSLSSEIRSRVGDRPAYGSSRRSSSPTTPFPTGSRRGDVEITEDFVVDETVASLLAEYALTEDQAGPRCSPRRRPGDAFGTEAPS